jgi:glucose-6-phosphate 1-dehydrogenase
MLSSSDAEHVPDGAAKRRPAEPFSLVIFGASGDLTRRKLVPAIYGLFRQGLLPERFSLFGFARSEMDDRAFAEQMREAVREHGRVPASDDENWRRFAACLHYHRGEYGDVESLRSLGRRLAEEAAAQERPDNRVFDLATPPQVFMKIVEGLRDAGLTGGNPGGWVRLVVEKPFGSDLASARELNRRIRSVFSEEQVFRIDHYLGKEAVQNILVFRFANSIFDPLWNQKYIDHVQITVSESAGVEGRGGYYDQTGTLRDMLQNHMMHLLCFLTMESPVDIGAQSVRDEKVKALKSLRRIPMDCVANGVVRGQYDAGELGGRRVPGYLEEDGVAPDSRTETFVALKTFVDNWRWAGVPFYLRTGKRLPKRLTQMSIHFKPVPQVLFNADSRLPLPPNVLILRIQPNEGISLRFQVKVPGLGTRIEPYWMDFGYGNAFGKELPDAYERLLLEAAIGDQTLFIRSDEVEAAWEFVNPIIEGCMSDAKRPLPKYPAGTWGPKEADELIEADGRRWDLFLEDRQHGAVPRPGDRKNERS